MSKKLRRQANDPVCRLGDSPARYPADGSAFFRACSPARGPASNTNRGPTCGLPLEVAQGLARGPAGCPIVVPIVIALLIPLVKTLVVLVVVLTLSRSFTTLCLF